MAVNNVNMVTVCAAVGGIVISGIAGEIEEEERKRIKKRKMWERSIFTEAARERCGDHNLLQEMRLNDTKYFFNYTRMSPKSFNKLLSLVGPIISKKDTNYRKSIPPSTKLALTLRYLASGSSQISLAYAYRVGKSTSCMIISETLTAIITCLLKKVMPIPTIEDWVSISEGFRRRWDFPNCIGAIDGKHIRIQAPPKSGSEFYNYKNYFSIILLAICDYRYRILGLDVGAQGRQSDSGVFQNSMIGGPILPFYLLGDEAFGLKPYLMTPYPGKSTGNLDYDKSIFNYRQSRARRIIENTFGILVVRWRILRTSLECSLKTADKIVQAIVCLHNFCLIEDEEKLPHQKVYLTNHLVDTENINGEVISGQWREDGENELIPIQKQASYNATLKALEIRNTLAEYFITDGSVPWQYDLVL